MAQTLLERLQERKLGVCFDQNTVFAHGTNLYYIDANIKMAESDEMFPVDGNNIVEFKWENILNGLFLTGSITVRDSTGSLGSVNGSIFTHVAVFFAKVEPIINEKTGLAVDYKFDEKNTFTHSFFVNSVELKDRERNEVDYTLYLISDMYFATTRFLYWSNYDKISNTGNKDKKYFNPFNILKELFTMAYANFGTEYNAVIKGSGFFPEGFDKAAGSCNLLVDYSTHTRTTIAESIDYLLNKTFYTKDEDQDKSLRMLVYDVFEKKFRLIDFKDSNTFVPVCDAATWISLNGTMLEELTVPIKQNYSSVNLISNREFFNTFIQYTWIGWNSGMQSFTGGNRKDFMSTKTTQDIVDYAKPGKNVIPKENVFKLDPGTKTRKAFDKIFNTPIPGYEDEVTYNKIDTTWNNTYSVYLDLIYNTIYKDALRFNTNGSIRHNPGSLISIVTDMDVNKKPSDDMQKEPKKPHNAISDIFFVVETSHIVHPNDGNAEKFTENLTITKWWEVVQ